MSWITPITSWDGVTIGLKYFNYTDWNRIEGNVNALVTLLQTCGYNLSLATITSRSDGSTLDFYDSINRIEGNILALFSCYGVAPPGWIAPKTSWTYDQPFSYVDPNRMESNELALYNQINGIIQEYVYCGQDLAICGLGWQN